MLTIVEIGHGPTEDSSRVRENTPNIEVHRILLDVRPIPIGIEFSDIQVCGYRIFSFHVPKFKTKITYILPHGPVEAQPCKG